MYDLVQNFVAYFPDWLGDGLKVAGGLLPVVGIAILLKSVVTKATDLIMFLLGFVLAGSMGLTLIAAALVGVAFGFINYQITMLRNSRVAVSAMDDDEEDI